MKRKPQVYASGAFYAVLCIFSIVTGLMYLRAGNVVNPLELPQSMAERMDDPEYMAKVSIFFGWLTFFVGIVQGLTSYSLIIGKRMWNYWLALGFTIFSILSAGTKLVTTLNIFPILKEIAYVAILIVILSKSTRTLFFRR